MTTYIRPGYGMHPKYFKDIKEKEKFCAEEFGNNYSERNVVKKWIVSNTAFFTEILKNTTNNKSVLEFGSNIGLNLIAVEILLSNTTTLHR